MKDLVKTDRNNRSIVNEEDELQMVSITQSYKHALTNLLSQKSKAKDYFTQKFSYARKSTLFIKERRQAKESKGRSKEIRRKPKVFGRST